MSAGCCFATRGLRRGELLGLRWSDVDLTNGRIAIRRTLVMVDGKPATAEPKTVKGRRSLTLAPQVLEAARGHRAHQAAERPSWGAGYTDSGLVITTEDGRPMDPETLSGLFGKPDWQGCQRSDCMTCGTRSRQSCWLRASTRRWSASCWVTPPSRSRWTPTATSSHRFSRKQPLSWPPLSLIQPQCRLKDPLKGRSGRSRLVVDRTTEVAFVPEPRCTPTAPYFRGWAGSSGRGSRR